MIGGIEETSASFEARSAPRSHPTEAVMVLDATLDQRAQRHFETKATLDRTSCAGNRQQNDRSVQDERFINRWLGLFSYDGRYQQNASVARSSQACQYQKNGKDFRSN
jgi:hypothetical protein